MKTPDGKTITFTFVSHPVKDAKARWAVNLTFPAGADADTPLPIAAEDGDGAPVESAVFEFAGVGTAVKNGKGALPYSAFVRGKHEKAIWLKRPGMDPVPGSLTFA